MLETLIAFQTALYILGIGGLVYWMNRQIGALKGTVDTQEKAIAAQAEQMRAQGETLKSFEGLLKTMQTVLESTDEPKMLERLEAYKDFLNHEKQAALQQQAMQFTEEKKQMTQEQQRASEDLTVNLSGMVDLVGALMPHFPPEQRRDLIDSIHLTTSLKDRVHRVAAEAPDLSDPLKALRESMVKQNQKIGQEWISALGGSQASDATEHTQTTPLSSPSST